MTHRVLICVPLTATDHRDVEHYAWQLALRLRRDYGFHTVLAYGSRDFREVTRLSSEEGVRRYAVPTLARRSPVRVRSGSGSTQALREIIRQERITIVNAHGPVTGIVLAAAHAAESLPFVLTHTARPPAERQGTPLPLRLYESVGLRLASKRADRVITTSEHVRNSFANLYSWKATTIAPGVDTGHFGPHSHGLGETLIFVGVLGSPATLQRLDDLLRAVALAHRRGHAISLTIVAGGNASRHYGLSRTLGLAGAVRFTGSLDELELVSKYHASRALVLPSHDDCPQWAILEALACGLPVVTTAAGRLAELVRDNEEGLVFPPGDVTRLADSLIRVCNDDQLAARLGRAARRQAEKLSWDSRLQATAQVFDEAAREKSAARRTRVALVSGHYQPRIGGLERYAGSLARGIIESPDLDVVVITSAPGRRRQWGVVDGAPVLRLPTLLTISNSPVSFSWLWQLPWALHRMKVDVVHAHAPVPGLADIAMVVSGRRRRVLTYHSGSMVKNTQGWIDTVLRLYEKHILPRVLDRADQVVAVSTTSLASKHPQAMTIAPGVDPEFTSSCRADGQGSSPYLLYVGRIERTSRSKGIDVLMRAYAELVPDFPTLGLWVVGDGDAIPEFAAGAQRLRLAGVRFPGALLGSDLVQAYCGAEVLILPSTSAESFGMCLIEAMACEVPVVATTVGGPSSIVSSEVDGLLVAPGDTAALATAVRRLLSNPQMRAQFGAAGRRKVVRDYVWSRQIEMYLNLYRGPRLSYSGDTCNSSTQYPPRG
jgi:glycosyltransferase involved in cell wall biosynthesis